MACVGISGTSTCIEVTNDHYLIFCENVVYTSLKAGMEHIFDINFGGCGIYCKSRFVKWSAMQMKRVRRGEIGSYVIKAGLVWLFSANAVS